jgi:FKBP-type peptidyl-prolyl cis-trans isomerase FklB
MVKKLATILAAATLAAAAHTQTAPPPPAQEAPAAPAQDNSVFKTKNEKNGYALGMEIGAGIRKQGLDVDGASFAKGFMDAFSGGKTLLSEEEMHTVLQAAQDEYRQQQLAVRTAKADAAKKEGDAFLAANKAKDGVIALPSGLQYKILKAGDGKKPTGDDTVVCNYRGTFLDGTEFDSSEKNGGPATFPVQGVIKGWTEALQLMPVGSKWQLYVPAELAYGESGTGNVIPPNATLIFDVELLSIKDDKAKDDKTTGATTEHP